MSLELKTTQQKIQDFKTPSGGGTSVARTPRQRVQLKSAQNESTDILGCVFGAPETGKTTVAAQLACAGFRVFMLFTDMGGDAGEKGGRVYAAKTNKLEEYEKNLYFARLDDLDTLKDFIADPLSVIPNLWSDANPDILFWDGFSFFQSIYVLPLAEEQANALVSGDAPDDGFSNAAMMKGWGLVRNGTVRPLAFFLNLRNPNKKYLHKIIAAGLKYRSETTGTVGKQVSKMVETTEPDIAGSAKQIMRYGFDFCLQTVRNGDKFVYLNRQQTAESFSKNRFGLPEVMEADFVGLWQKMLTQSGVKS